MLHKDGNITWKRLFIWGLALSGTELLAFCAVAYRIDFVVSAQSFFHFPYSMYLEALLRAYWWVPTFSVPSGVVIIYCRERVRQRMQGC
jgi:hypothetical protein